MEGIPAGESTRSNSFCTLCLSVDNTDVAQNENQTLGLMFTKGFRDGSIDLEPALECHPQAELWIAEGQLHKIAASLKTSLQRHMSYRASLYDAILFGINAHKNKALSISRQ